MRSSAPSLPGVPWWGALIVAIVVTGIGVLIDGMSGDQLSSTFTLFYVLGCVAAVVAVRYRALFTAMAQPPLLLLLMVPLGQELVASGSTAGLKDLALNVVYPLVNRFPAMLLATVLALTIGGARIFLTHRNTGVRARRPARSGRTPAPARGASRKTAGAGGRKAAGAAGRGAEAPVRTAPPRAAQSPAADRGRRGTPRGDLPRAEAAPVRSGAPRRAPARATRETPVEAKTRVTTKASVRDVVDTRGAPAVRRSAPPGAAAGVDPARQAQPYPPRQVRYRDRVDD